MKSAVKQNLDLIQMLRGIASLLVVLMHTTINAGEKMHFSFFGGFFSFGGAGVDIFFVLSGFIITYINRRSVSKRSNFPQFLRRRCVRIFPVYWVIITLFLLLQFMLPSFYSTHYSLSFSNVIGTYLLLPGHIMVNGVSWTLSYELFFYFIFSLAFLIRNKLAIWVLSIAYVLVLIAVPFTGYNFVTGNNWKNLALFPMNLEFFMGIIAALIIPKINRQLGIAFLITGTVGFLTSALLFNNGYTLNSLFNRVVLFGIPSFFIIAGIVRYELDRKIKVHNKLVLLGEASYSLYLLHLPFVVAGMIILSKLNLQSELAKYAAVIVLILGVCIGSILFFKWVERPLINRLNTKK